jgi:hypothetical protein
MFMTRSWLAVFVVVSAVAFAADTRKKGTSTKVDLGLNLGNVPSAHGLEAPKEKAADQPKATPAHAEYSVVRVQHGKAFLRTPEGAKPSAPYDSVATDGDPPTTEKFSTVVRVKCTQKVNAPIELAVLDPRGDTLMDARGEIVFRGVKESEVDYTVDWDRTQLIRGPGDYQVLVRVAGTPLGTYPLKVQPPPAREKK